MKKILVIGSINMDIVNQVNEHPLPGQTIHGSGVRYFPGGKGANQAVAASLAGGTVQMIGAIGRDFFGSDLLTSMSNHNVDVHQIIQKDTTSGLAFITIDSKGENTIILSQGANGKLSIRDIEQLLFVLEDSHILLIQNEIPWETNEFVIKEAAKRRVRVFVNPAPAFHVPKEIYPEINVLIVNQIETEIITGIIINELSDAKKAATLMIKDGVENILITMGTKGSYFVDSNGKGTFTPAYKVDAVDTTAAGDTFIGAFAAAMSLDRPIEECLRFATAASAIGVTRVGAQSSIPNIVEIEGYLKESNLG